MKRAKQSKFIFLWLGIFIMALQGCKDKSSALIRTWKLEDMKYTKEIPREMRPTFDKSIEQLKRTLRVTYHADGSYTTIMSQGELDGTWKLNWNSSKIISTSDKGEKKEYTILGLTPDKFTFKAMEGQSEVTFVMVPENK